MRQPLVSIIIPCFNYEDYVEQSIISATDQTYKNIELIVINDGSTDGSGEVISKLKKIHNFKYVDQKNVGIIRTRNKGIDLAKGEYLVQLDADDWLDPGYVEKTLEVALKKEVDIVYTQAQMFGAVNFITNFKNFNKEYLKHNNFMHASSLVSKSIFDNRRYDDYLDDKWYEDWDLFLDACMDGHKAALLDLPLLNYRKHENVLSRSSDLDNTFKEMLVRHHIMSKQNAKHPNEMWYFSSYINILKHCIDERVDIRGLEQRLSDTERRLERYNKYLPIKTIKIIRSKFK